MHTWRSIHMGQRGSNQHIEMDDYPITSISNKPQVESKSQSNVMLLMCAYAVVYLLCASVRMLQGLCTGLILVVSIECVHYMHTHPYTSACIQLHTHIPLYTYAWVHTRMCKYMCMYMHACQCVCVNVRVYVCIITCVCMCMCMFIYRYMYI